MAEEPILDEFEMERRRYGQPQLGCEMNPLIEQVILTTQVSSTSYSNPKVHNFTKYLVFSRLIITTTTSSFLLWASLHRWTIPGPGGFYNFILTNRASSQLVVQIVAYALGFIHVSVICTLINYASRIRINSRPTSLNTIQFYHDLCVQNIEWSLPLPHLVLLVLFVAVAIVPSALWAGAVTPVSVLVATTSNILVPSYPRFFVDYGVYINENGTRIRSVRSTNGYFSYDVGRDLQVALLESSGAATTADGKPRQHRKLDNTLFTYYGRSYGVGASVGLVDETISKNPLVKSYSYQEIGYNSQVICNHDPTSNFTLSENGTSWEASGYLPGGEWPVEIFYPGPDPDAIVSLGVSLTSTPRQTSYVGIAAGDNYEFLDKIQCLVEFQPTLFNVSVGIVGRNITVTPVSTSANIEPSQNLTDTAMRQFMLLAANQNTLYVSPAGESFNSSINNYKFSLQNEGQQMISDDEAALAGVRNSIIAVIDDILGAYAMAQIMVLGSTSNTTGNVISNAYKFGEDIYIYSVIVVNGFVCIAMLGSCCMTRGWKDLREFDYMKLASLMRDCSRGGVGLSILEDEKSLQGLSGQTEVLYSDGKVTCAGELYRS